jgi:uncharacterized membrane protein
VETAVVTAVVAAWQTVVMAVMALLVVTAVVTAVMTVVVACVFTLFFAVSFHSFLYFGVMLEYAQRSDMYANQQFSRTPGGPPLRPVQQQVTIDRF